MNSITRDQLISALVGLDHVSNSFATHYAEDIFAHAEQQVVANDLKGAHDAIKSAMTGPVVVPHAPWEFGDITTFTLDTLPEIVIVDKLPNREGLESTEEYDDENFQSVHAEDLEEDQVLNWLNGHGF
jgi:hypothetical protein